MEFLSINIHIYKLRSPMNPDFPFLEETTNNYNYKPFKTK